MQQGTSGFIDFATQQFKAQIKDQLGDDGLWPESINTYHFYPLDGFLAFVEAAANNGDNLYDWEPKPGKGIKAMFTAPLRYAYPNMRLAAINDGWVRILSSPGTVHIGILPLPAA